MWIGVYFLVVNVNSAMHDSAQWLWCIFLHVSCVLHHMSPNCVWCCAGPRHDLHPSGPLLRQECTSLLHTLHVIIILGVGQMCRKKNWHPRVSRKRDWTILMHGNCRYGCYTKIVFWSKIEKCKQFAAARFRTLVEFYPRVSRPDQTNPPCRADFSISPSGFNYDMQTI